MSTKNMESTECTLMTSVWTFYHLITHVLTVCQQPVWPAFKGEGEGGIWAHESMWGARRRKQRNACKDAIVFCVFHAQILSVKIVIGQN